MFYSCLVRRWGGRLPKTVGPFEGGWWDWCFIFSFFFFFVPSNLQYMRAVELARAWEHVHTDRLIQTRTSTASVKSMNFDVKQVEMKPLQTVTAWLRRWESEWCLDWESGTMLHSECLINTQHALYHMLPINKCRCSSHNLLGNHSVCRLDYTKADSSSTQPSLHCNNQYVNDQRLTEIVQTIL